MSDGITVTVDDDDLDRAFLEMSESAEKGVLRRVGIAALQPFDASWRGKVRKRTGALSESGGVGTKLSRSQKAAAEREAYVEIYAGPGALVQAIQEEFGNRHEAPHPYVRPAWDETQQQVVDGAVDGLRPEVDKTLARNAARARRLAGL